MSVYVHPDGYYQVTSLADLQKVSAGSIMAKMYRGWNERRYVHGLPILAYIDRDFVEVDSLDEGIIHADAILQNARFWRTIQEMWINSSAERQIAFTGPMPSFFPVELAQLGGYTDPSFFYDTARARSWEQTASDDVLALYAVGAYPTTGYSKLRSLYGPDETTGYDLCGSFFRKYRSSWSTGYMQEGDAIGAHVLNDILKALHYLKARHLSFDTQTTRNYTSTESTQGDVGEACASVVQSFYGQPTQLVTRRTDQGFDYLNPATGDLRLTRSKIVDDDGDTVYLFGSVIQFDGLLISASRDGILLEDQIVDQAFVQGDGKVFVNSAWQPVLNVSGMDTITVFPAPAPAAGRIAWSLFDNNHAAAQVGRADSQRLGELIGINCSFPPYTERRDSDYSSAYSESAYIDADHLVDLVAKYRFADTP